MLNGIAYSDNAPTATVITDEFNNIFVVLSGSTGTVSGHGSKTISLNSVLQDAGMYDHMSDYMFIGASMATNSTYVQYQPSTSSVTYPDYTVTHPSDTAYYSITVYNPESATNFMSYKIVFKRLRYVGG